LSLIRLPGPIPPGIAAVAAAFRQRSVTDGGFPPVADDSRLLVVR